ncbi:PTS sugar transporter subunit IIA [Liquorilactobacillus satsumensis]|uniref:Phosphotransferase system, mannose fructose-specific component IIA n=2 Tax=Liquorilactobacillus satsumensis TaxID=259059 RepID=A0A0R1V004_9LACO|nr:PTS sugar transporter subunit IIA [Liquorilactobacillus satsumensis]KRL99021.1 Phosphotransferase system, mannose fructose-specific component IIA [Liquorilactobacillus satsumensis DSM 16230 = JCM 12392]MCC7666904.1 PTS sugar transporter [Liquorilactobacillus satsumensis]MCP9357186.1 PTS sugar transporter subunit IIA [Liquorilactobacillus satsumensis]MCP9371133.1 PTS sugar transporter subunit IIA [Liquorilactobacillus satsumensis]
MNKIEVIISGHGKFASGVQGALKLLTKIPKTWHFCDFKEGMSDSDLKTIFEDIIKNNSNSECLFFTDLVGGTPYKVAATIAYGKKKITVVAGCNLGSLLEAIYSNFSTANEFGEALVEISKKGTKKLSFNALYNTATSSKSNTSGGI